MVQIHSPRPFFQSDEELETGELKLSSPVFDYNGGMYGVQLKLRTPQSSL